MHFYTYRKPTHSDFINDVRNLRGLIQIKYFASGVVQKKMLYKIICIPKQANIIKINAVNNLQYMDIFIYEKYFL